MIPQKNKEPKLKILSVRRSLIKLHSDLLEVEGCIKKYSDYYPPKLTNLEKMVLILEDRRFFLHRGVDIKSALRELIRAITFRRHGGASTIDMQFVRTATGYRQRTLSRKFYEMLLATIIQFRYSKLLILRSYLSCAYFGSHLKGTNSASQKVFQKPDNNLTVEEASFIAAMLVYPRPFTPTESWKSKVQRRADYGKRIHVASKNRFE
jgi:membrane peptidoglycan carboxypeptidase